MAGSLSKSRVIITPGTELRYGRRPGRQERCTRRLARLAETFHLALHVFDIRLAFLANSLSGCGSPQNGQETRVSKSTTTHADDSRLNGRTFRTSSTAAKLQRFVYVEFFGAGLAEIRAISTLTGRVPRTRSTTRRDGLSEFSRPTVRLPSGGGCPQRGQGTWGHGQRRTDGEMKRSRRAERRPKV